MTVQGHLFLACLQSFLTGFLSQVGLIHVQRPVQ